MGCGRRGTGSDEERALRKIAEAHERLGLSGVFEHIENAVSAADESVRHLNHADRAAALDEPAEVVELGARQASNACPVHSDPGGAGVALETLQGFIGSLPPLDAFLEQAGFDQEGGS